MGPGTWNRWFGEEILESDTQGVLQRELHVGVFPWAVWVNGSSFEGMFQRETPL